MLRSKSCARKLDAIGSTECSCGATLWLSCAVAMEEWAASLIRIYEVLSFGAVHDDALKMRAQHMRVSEL